MNFVWYLVASTIILQFGALVNHQRDIRDALRDIRDELQNRNKPK